MVNIYKHIHTHKQQTRKKRYTTATVLVSVIGHVAEVDIPILSSTLPCTYLLLSTG